uniref:Uncharacterized protein n=1 Tax=Arion vulgaris TaxID=1028688 RepID=A0A0B7BYH4_9EUPU
MQYKDICKKGVQSLDTCPLETVSKHRCNTDVPENRQCEVDFLAQSDKKIQRK